MSHLQHRRGRLFATGLLAGLGCCAPLLATAVDAPPADESDQPGARSDSDGGDFTVTEAIDLAIVDPEILWRDGETIQYGLSGFILDHGPRRLVGRALRFNLDRQTLFATGSIVLTQPGVRVEAERFGGDARLDSGEAWQVQVLVPHSAGAIRIDCERITFDSERIVCYQVRADGGHGGLARVAAASIEIGLRPETREDRNGVGRYLTHIAIRHPLVRLGPLPILYLPLLYRDYRLDYPWTRYELGDSSLHGPWIRFWTGINIPLGGEDLLHLRGRIDRYERIGTAYGLRPEWHFERLGDGELLYYSFDSERVHRHPGRTEPLDIRHAHVTDVSHHLPLPGGAAQLRWTELPDGDPDPDDPDPGARIIDDRFRRDFLRDDLDERPIARRAVHAAWTAGPAAIGYRVDLPPERRDGLRVEGELGLLLPAERLFGPVHLTGAGTVSRLRLSDRPVEAQRTRFRTGLAVGHWFSWGLGLDASASLDGVSIGDAAEASGPLPEADQWIPVFEAGSSLRWAADFGRLRHTITPRVGLEATGTPRGDEELPTLPFDTALPDADRRYLVTELQTALNGAGRSFLATVIVRWGLRREDAPIQEDKLDPDPPPPPPGEDPPTVDTVEDVWDRIVDVDLDLSGSPHPGVNLGARGVWDGAMQDWSSFDSNLSLQLGEHILLSGTATYRPVDERWEYRPQLTISGNRYELMAEGHVDTDEDYDGSERLRAFELTLGRRMVDGEVLLSYEVDRYREADDEGDAIDHTVRLGFALHPFAMPEE